MHYSGIGSRKISKSIEQDMEQFACVAANKGWILRSGGASGSDSAFERGCDRVCGQKEIFLPWMNFNNNKSQYIAPTFASQELAKTIHPAYNKLSEPARLLLARNMHLVLGPQLNDPVKFVICFTPDGVEHHSNYSSKTGGTGSAIALASKNFIPIFNIFEEQRLEAALEFLLNPTEGIIL
ncbi:hypothetical protein M0R04_07515 [Candidatus Dojkabacteria bacterium]|jgi:hypothetical protein|nr:hypothetical protein [Candidatus Dojkabacteria bacterium]